MKVPKIVIGVIISFCILSCNKYDDNTEENNAENFVFEDGFETQNNSLDELFLSNGSRWTGIQQVDPSNGTNDISISTTTSSEGQNSLRLFANPSDDVLSKMDIEKSGFSAFKNDKVVIKADFYVSGTANIENLLLIDFECCSCWDTSTNVDNQCPGIRLQMSGGNDFLSIERGKIGESTMQQTSIQFPRNEWVTVQWELTLSDANDGANKLLINGTEVINNTGTNMPNAETFRDLFAQEGIDFTLQEPVFYERIQIGATANPTSESVELFVDDFSITIEKSAP